MPPMMFDVSEVADRLRIGKTFVYDMMERGELPYVKLGRRRLVDARDVEALISRNKIGSRPGLEMAAARI